MNYGLIKHAILAVLVGVFSFSASAGERPKPRVLNYNELKQLNPKIRTKYIKMMSAALVRIEAQNPKLSIKGNKRQKFSWIDTVFGSAWADADELRCIYGGFVVFGDQCSSKSNFEVQLSWRAEGDQVQSETKSLSCGDGEALCNPMLYGLGESESGLCLPTNRLDFTRACHEAAYSTEEAERRTGTQVSKILGANMDKWEEFQSHIDQICADSFINNSERVRNRDDLRSTCEQAMGNTNDIRVALDNYNKSKSQTLTSSERPKERPLPQSSAIAEDSETESTSANTEDESSEQSSVDAHNVASNVSNVCEGIDGNSRYTMEARCTACAIQVNERQQGSEDFQVSERWMNLLQAAASVCGKPMNEMVQQFGYCGKREGWDDSSMSIAAINEIIKNGNALLEDKEKFSLFGPNHFVRKQFRDDFGFSPYAIEKFFCNGKEQFRSTLQQAAELEGQMIYSPNQVYSFRHFRDCSQEALGIAAKTAQDNQREFVFNSENPKSRYENLRCVAEATSNWGDALIKMKSSDSPIVVEAQNGRCQVVLGEADQSGKVVVFDGFTGKTDMVANSKFFTNKQNSYKSLSCDPTRGLLPHEMTAEERAILN